MSKTESIADFFWLTPYLDQIKKAYWNHYLANSFILHSNTKNGSDLLAKNIAEWLLCETKTTSNISGCAVCRGCRLFLSGNHPDFMYITCTNSRNQITIEQVKQINEFVYRSAQEPLQYKIIIIHPADSMNIHAANALLKLLEESNGKVIFFLVVEGVCNLLSTIVSRCQYYHIKEPTHAEALQWLQKQKSIAHHDRHLLETALKVARGSPFSAKLVIEQGICEQYLMLNEQFKLLLKREVTPTEIVNLITKLTIDEWLLWSLELIESIITIQFSITKEKSSSYDMAGIVQYLANKNNPIKTFKLRDWILDCRYLFIKQININEQLLKEVLLIKLLELLMKD